MFKSRKNRSRRAEIRRNRPDLRSIGSTLGSPVVLASLAIAVLFWAGAAAILSLRHRMVAHRPDQFVHQDITSRVDFSYRNPEWAAQLRQHARESAPRFYRAIPEGFEKLEKSLLSLPEEVSLTGPQLTRDLRLDSGFVTALKRVQTENASEYKKWVGHYVGLLNQARDAGRLVILTRERWDEEARSTKQTSIKVLGADPSGPVATVDDSRIYPFKADAAGELQRTDNLLRIIAPLAEQSFLSSLASDIARYTVDTLPATHQLDADLTAREQLDAADKVSLAPAVRHVPQNAILVPKGESITQAQWKVLAEEQRAYVAQLTLKQLFSSYLGIAGITFLFTVAISLYVAIYQPRIIRNHARALGISALLLSMLLLAQIAGIGTGPIMLFGLAPTLLAAIILAIAYDQRFAIGIASLHGLLVTMALDQHAGFFLILWMGILAASFLLDEVRTRSKLVEVGGATAIVMILAAAAVGAAMLEPKEAIGRNCLYAGAAALGVGFVVLGILPFIEKVFKITTSMTLLELADASQPLLRRLCVEAPGTYSHSLQVATLAEAAAEAIGANSLLCRVGSYYHDVGKMNKADYFYENQANGQNRHLNLSPNVSLLIIIGHVKDGVELAREYNLPPAILPVIQQHHGTTLVEYFFHQARKQSEKGDGEQSEVSDIQYRYPGPKPRTRETAIVMIADAVESASRSMVEPTANRLETIVHDLIMKRLLDGQFDDADLTFAELQRIETSLVKTLLAIYHGRLAYPSTKSLTHGPPAVVKSA